MKRKRNHEGGGIVAGLLELLLDLCVWMLTILFLGNSDE